MHDKRECISYTPFSTLTDPKDNKDRVDGWRGWCLHLDHIADGRRLCVVAGSIVVEDDQPVLKSLQLTLVCNTPAGNCQLQQGLIFLCKLTIRHFTAYKEVGKGYGCGCLASDAVISSEEVAVVPWCIDNGPCSININR